MIPFQAYLRVGCALVYNDTQKHYKNILSSHDYAIHKFKIKRLNRLLSNLVKIIRLSYTVEI
uniref:Uncharacterized protein n=1 Tax=Megaviridae environmental sample TaxID=1737588 RepID=A0A5J6VJ78_9VIRU|nr:MAG: hypothetical protein [Megaviridae environmental sample]